MTTETTPTIPTEDEILTRLNEREALHIDLFGFETSEYVAYLGYEHAKAFIKPEITKQGWDEIRLTLTREGVVARMLDYMSFAWDKAKSFRGISASRSISHYIAWTWLAGDKELSKELEKDYEFYGKDHLVKICRHYGWDPDRWDDHVRVNSESER